MGQRYRYEVPSFYREGHRLVVLERKDRDIHRQAIFDFDFVDFYVEELSLDRYGSLRVLIILLYIDQIKGYSITCSL